MRNQLSACFVGMFAGMVVLLASEGAQARPIEVDSGRWRLELQGVDVIHSTTTDRDGDHFVSGSVEYEMPTALTHLNFGIRAYPLFAYRAQEDIFGVAVGVTFRYYLNEDTHDGFYAEAGSGPIWLSHYLEGNSSRVNFLNELGIGYKFRDNPWSLSLKYQHISNAGLGHDNAGVNGIAFGVGYTF